MFERFTDRARRVVVLAQEEARLLNHNYIGTEHILLGLLREETSVAATILGERGMRLAAVREDVKDIVSDKAATGRSKETPLLSEFSRDLTEDALDTSQWARPGDLTALKRDLAQVDAPTHSLAQRLDALQVERPGHALAEAADAQNGGAQVALALGGHLGENVAFVCMLSLNLSTPGDGKSLLSTGIRLHFRHNAKFILTLTYP